MQHSQVRTESPEKYLSLDFETVSLHEHERGYWVVTVRGQKPHANMRVDLVPMIYVHQPEYWSIRIRGCVLDDIADPTQAPYQARLPLMGAKGTKGIEIVGASKSQCYDVPCG